jgi:putative FmdB family regulatory protein
MPTYEYACLSCKRHTEAVQSFSDEPLRTCPHCGGPLRRVFHPVGVVLKGSGFYSTDNRPSRRPAEPKKEKEAAKSSEGAASDSGSAAKREETSAGRSSA